MISIQLNIALYVRLFLFFYTQTVGTISFAWYSRISHAVSSLIDKQCWHQVGTDKNKKTTNSVCMVIIESIVRFTRTTLLKHARQETGKQKKHISRSRSSTPRISINIIIIARGATYTLNFRRRNSAISCNRLQLRFNSQVTNLYGQEPLELITMCVESFK